MRKHDVIVIGGSAGSLTVLKDIVGKLPSDFPAAILIVWHLSPDSPGILPEILNRLGTLPASNARDGEKIEAGRVYVAPPDHHLLMEKNLIEISKGPKENRFRPAIDPLFRSAAHYGGSRVVGVILSGGLDDGVAGLWSIKDHGGTVIVQEPLDAENPSMPRNAIQKVKVNHIVPGHEIADLLIRLCGEEFEGEAQTMTKSDEKTEIEIGIASEDGALKKGVLKLGAPSYFTCPECHGVLLEIVEDKNIRFRCHTGHAYSTGTLLSEVTESVEDTLWNALRAMEENVLLLNHLSRHLKDSDEELSKIYAAEALKIEQRTDRIRRSAMENGTSPGADNS